MSVIDLITRVDTICKKYDKYDIDKQKELNNISGDDAFARLYSVVEADLEAALQKSETAATERSRASAVAMNAEIRRTKARLLQELPKLRRLAPKKVKGLSREDLEARSDLVSVLQERIEAIPDGSTSGAKQTGGLTDPTSSYAGIKIDTSDGKFDSEYFQHTEESDRFRNEYEMRRIKQASISSTSLELLVSFFHIACSESLHGSYMLDFIQDQGLDVIAEGLDTLKHMAGDMNEEIDRQVPLMDEIDDKVERANADLKNTNVKLKDTIVQLRSSRNFCIDIILLCLILGIAAYLYNVLK
ncbi:hypothetical protein ACLB2K_072031 [Fragaria x ananassa]